MTDWAAFVLTRCRGLPSYLVSHLVGQPASAVDKVRAAVHAGRVPAGSAKPYHEAFAAFRGRAPADEDWPAPRCKGQGRAYEWLPPEDVLLATQVGLVAKTEIARLLTLRLRGITQDPSAERTENAVQVRMKRLGLISTDVLGGLTISQAAKEVGSLTTIQQAVNKGRLTAKRVGRLWVIPYDAWEAWKQKVEGAPDGYVQLSTLRERLGIRSDKLSEFARMGYVPGAIRCKPYGSNVRTTQYGTWFVTEAAAAQLLEDRVQGKRMPWQGKPMLDNLKATWRLFEERRHPASCETCAHIWGPAGAPLEFDDYMRRYPGLDHGAKRHLTMVWSPGLTIPQVATLAARSQSYIRRAISNGVLTASQFNGTTYITRTAATRWIAQNCPTGDSDKPWLAIDIAAKRYGFAIEDLEAHIASGATASKLGTDGAMRGIRYVLRQQCVERREREGFTEDEAARRAGVTVERLRVLLEGVTWRVGAGIPLSTLQAVMRRQASAQGYTVADAARELSQTEQWVHDQVAAGKVKLAKTRWDERRYFTEPMMRALRRVAAEGPLEAPLSDEWVPLSIAASVAGVTAATIRKWARGGRLQEAAHPTGNRYLIASVRACATEYWRANHRPRAVPPDWFSASVARSP
jgi:excisionase family DNA binding protein